MRGGRTPSWAILANHGTTARDRTTAGRELYDLAREHQSLLDRIARATAASRLDKL